MRPLIVRCFPFSTFPKMTKQLTKLTCCYTIAIIWPNIIISCIAFYIIMTLIFLVGIIPLLAGLSIKTITNNLVLVGYTLRMVTAVSIIRLPKLMPEQWKKSFLHVPDSVFYTIRNNSILREISASDNISCPAC